MSSRLLLTKLFALLCFCLGGFGLITEQANAQAPSVALSSRGYNCGNETITYSATVTVGGTNNVSTVLINVTPPTGPVQNYVATQIGTSGVFEATVTVANPNPASTFVYSATAVATAQNGQTGTSGPVANVILPAASGFTITPSAASLCRSSSLTLTGSAGFTLVSVSGPFDGSPALAGFTGPDTFTLGTASNIQSGTYTATATNANGCPATASTVISVTQPTAPTNIATNKGSFVGCVGSPLVFTANCGTNTTIFKYPGGLEQANYIETLSTPYQSSYTVVCRSADGCESTPVVQSFTIATNPTAAASVVGSATVCPGSSVSLTASGGTTYAWSNGLTGSTVTFAASNSSAAAATQTYSVTVSDANACTALASTTISVQPAVTAGVGVNGVVATSGTVCVGEKIFFTGSDGLPGGAPNPNYQYTWSSTAGPLSDLTGQTSALTAVQAGVVNLTVVSLSTGCVGTTSYSVSVKNLPTISSVVVSPATACIGSVVTYQITPSAGVTSVVGAVTSGAAIAAFSPATASAPYTFTTTALASGSATASFTAVDGSGCVSSASGIPSSATVAVVAAPAGSLTLVQSPTLACAGVPVSLSATGITGATNYSLNTGSTVLTSSTGVFTVVAPSATSTYTVTAGNAAPSCTLSGTGVITVQPAVTAGFGVGGVLATSTTTCVGSAIFFTASDGVAGGAPNGGYIYTWSSTAGPLSNLTGQTSALTVTQSGVVSLTVASFGTSCSAVATYVVSATQPQGPTTVGTNTGSFVSCTGSPLTFTATCPAGTPVFKYPGPPAGEATGFVQTLSTPYQSSYTVVCRVNGCDSQPTVQSFTILAPPSATAGVAGSATVCPGTTVSLTAAGGTSYAWSNGLGSSSTASFVAANTSVTAVSTVYNVTVTNGSGCTALASTTVTVQPSVTAGFGVGGALSTSAVACVNSQIFFTASDGVAGGAPNGGYLYYWSSTAGPLSNLTGQTSAVTVKQSGVVSLTVASFGTSCSATATYVISATQPQGPTAVGTNTGSFVSCAGSPLTFTATCPTGTPVFKYPTGEASGQIQTLSTPYTESYSVVCRVNGCDSQPFVQSFTILNPSSLTAGVVGSATVCPGTTVSLTATGGSSYVWSNGLGTGSTVSFVASNTTATAITNTYNVTVTNGASCSALGSVAVTIQPSVTAGFGVGGVLATSSTVCVGTPIFFTASDGVAGGAPNGGYLYYWSSTAGPLSATTGQAVAVTANTSGVVNLTVASFGTSCSATATYVISATQPSAPQNIATNRGSFVGCAGTPLTFTATCPTGTPVFKYPTGESTGFIQTLSTPYQESYTVVCRLGSCESTPVVQSFTILAPITVSAGVVGSATVCPGTTVSLTATGGSSYAWSNGLTGSNVSFVTSNTSATAVTTTYSVTVTGTAGCTALASADVTVQPSVTAGFGVNGSLSTSTVVCAGSTVFFTGSDGLPGGAPNPNYQYFWSSTAGPLSQTSGQAVAVTAQQTGVVNLTVVSLGTGCVGTATYNVTVNPTPSGAISANPGFTVCSGTSVSLTAPLGGTYAWTGPNGFTASTQTIVLPSQPTTLSPTYSVSVVGAAGGCSAPAFTATVYYRELPTAPTVAQSSINVCVGSTATLQVTNCPTGTAKLYIPANAGGGSSSNGANSTLAYSLPTNLAAGTYSYSAVCASQLAPTNCESVPTVINVTVYAAPTPAIASSQTALCPGQVATLTASGGDFYTWSNGLTGPSITVGAGSYTVTASKVYAGGTLSCPAIATVNIINSPVPTASITPSQTIVCQGTEVTLTATGTGNYLWSNGATTPTITVTPGFSQNYSVVVTNAAGCSASAVATVSVNPAPALQVFGTTNIYVGQPTTLIATGANTYAWSNGVTGATNTVSPAITTTYSVTGIGASGCASTTSVTVNVMPLPAAPSIAPGTNVQACAGQTVVLTASCGTGTPRFKTTGSVTDGSTLAVTTSTNYTVVCVVAGNVEGNATVGSVTFNALPTAGISGYTGPVCAGSSVVLTATGGTSYAWSNGATTPSITVSPQATTLYSVVVTNAAGCTSVASQNVVVNPTPAAAAVASPSTIFVGQQSTLQASGGIGYQWSNGANGATVFVSPTTTTVYTVTVTGANLCQSTATVTVNVNPAPQAPTVTPGTTLQACLGQVIDLTASCQTGMPQFVRGNTIINSATYSVASPVAGPVVVQVYCTLSGVQSAATPVTVNSNPPPNVAISGDGKICNTSGSITGATLTATGATSYLWSTGATTPTVTVTTPGLISVTGVTAGCSNVAQVNTFTAVCGTGQALAITGASINCSTRVVTINTTGGDGTPIQGRILLVTQYQPLSQPLVLDAGVFSERKPIQLQVMQNNVMSPVFNFDYSAQCPAGGGTTPPPASTTAAPGNTATITVCGQPYTLTGAPFSVSATFNCNTGAIPHVINFVPTGGLVDANSVIEFMSIGITGWTQNCSAQLDPGNTDNNSFTIMARQRNTQTGNILVSSQITVTSPCQPKTGAGREATTVEALEVTVLGNPTLSDKVEVEVRGAEGQRLQLRMTDGQGASVSEIAVEKANSVERQTIGLGRSAGMYFLQVITPTKVKTVKVIHQ